MRNSGNAGSRASRPRILKRSGTEERSSGATARPASIAACTGSRRLTSQTARQSRRTLPSASMATGRATHARQQLVALRHQPLGLRQQSLARRSQNEPASDALEQPAGQHLLEPLDLLAGGGLAHVERGRGGGHAAAVDDGQEGAQQINHKKN